MKFNIKYILALFTILILISSPAFKVKAVNVDELKAQLAALQAQIAQLVLQIKQAEAQPSVWCHNFNTKLGVGDYGNEVAQLHTALKKAGVWNVTGFASDKFDEETASYVVAFQQKYYKDILEPWGLKYGTGYVGKTTLSKLTELFGCKNQDGQNQDEYSCLGEGDEIRWYDETATAKCCDGLTKLIHPNGFSQDCGAISKSAISVCAYCGNGVCGVGENKCNCPQDCSDDVITKSIRVISPNGGEQLLVENTYEIKWVNETVGVERVKISVCSDTPLLSQQKYTCWELAGMGSGIESTGSYKWTIDPNAPYAPGKKLKIRITDYEKPSVYDESDNYFSIGTYAIATPDNTICTDTDEGKNYYVKGTIDDGTTRVTDVCDSGNVKEYYCDRQSEIISESYRCPYGCEKGACKKGITIVSPNGGETLNADEVYNIKWDSSNMPYSRINIDLINQTCVNGLSNRDDTEQCIKAISHGASASPGFYRWINIPIFLTGAWESGDEFKIRITEVKSNGIYGVKDESDNSFRIVDSSKAEIINMLSPNGGEILTKGTPYTIRWHSNTESARVVIETQNELGKAVIDGLPAVIANNEVLVWNIPNSIPNGKYKMKISICPISFSDLDCANTDLAPYGYDFSDDYFDITE